MKTKLLLILSLVVPSLCFGESDESDLTLGYILLALILIFTTIGFAWVYAKVLNLVTKGWVGRQNFFLQVGCYIVAPVPILMVVALVGQIYQYLK